MRIVKYDMENESNDRTYISPNFEVVEIEFEQNILGGSGELPPYTPEDY